MDSIRKRRRAEPCCECEKEVTLIVQIADLDLMSRGFKLKCRVVKKDKVKNFASENPNAEVEKCYLNLHFADENDDISAITFGRENCRRFDSLLKLNKVYEISHVDVISVNKRFTCLKNNYQLMLNQFTEVTPVKNTYSIPTQIYDFTSFNKLENTTPGEVVDLIGVVEEIGDCVMVQSYKKQHVYLIDPSDTVVKITLWNEQARLIPEEAEEERWVVALKGVKVGAFNKERGLNVNERTDVCFNPPLPLTKCFKKWRNKKEGACGVNGTSVEWPELPGDTPLKSIADLQCFGAQIFVKGMIVRKKRDCNIYKACVICNSKLNKKSGKLYKCSKCLYNGSRFAWHTVLSVVVGDHSGESWVTLFNEASEKLFGMSCGENISSKFLVLLREEDPELFQEKYDALLFKTFVFNLRSYMEKFEGEQRRSTICADLFPVVV